MLEAARVRRAHERAAVAGAAATVLAVYLYPDRADAFDELVRGERPAGRARAGSLDRCGRSRTRPHRRLRRGAADDRHRPAQACGCPRRPAFCPAQAARGYVADMEHRLRLAVPARASAGVRQPPVRTRDARGLRAVRVADRGAEADRRLLGRRARHRDAARPLEPDRRRPDPHPPAGICATPPAPSQPSTRPRPMRSSPAGTPSSPTGPNGR